MTLSSAILVNHTTQLLSDHGVIVWAAPIYMPPDETKMTREGAERLSTGSSSRVKWKPPSVLVAKLCSNPSADVDLPVLDCSTTAPPA